MSDADRMGAQPTNDGAAKPQNHDRNDMEILYKIYFDKRLKSQADFYKSRVRENQSNANFTFLVSTAVMSISALVAAVSAVVSSPFFSLLSAILPAFAALLAAFRQLYGWERQSSIYQDALMGLERVKLLTPDKDEMATADLASIYPQLVAGGEEVFTAEVNQWGQFVQNTDKTADESSDSRVTNALMSDLRLTDEQVDTIRKIVAAGTPKQPFSGQTITVHPEETSALPSGQAQAAPASVSVQMTPPTTAATTIDTAPLTVTTTRRETATIHPVESTSFMSDDESSIAAQAAPVDPTAPIAVTTTRVDTTVVEHVIPAADAPVAEAFDVNQVPTDETQYTPVAEGEAPVQESSDSLTPGAMHVDGPVLQEDIDALTNHQEFSNEPPPPEAFSSLAPGAMHVDEPQAPPENPDADVDPNANG